ncbi:MAG: F0F1 ATP synthase subunit alpha, partial [Candidatus Wildermuthbacteria bacterium]|nr:F0F1 ATP synthase subunit alpha [Candidatus Wildermuthbacteria bacterium]
MAKEFLVDILKKELEGKSLAPKGEEIGKVVSVGDGVVQIEGLPQAMFSEMVDIEGTPALILNLEEYTAGAVVLGQDTAIKEGDIVRRTGKVLSVPVGESLLGRVVNPLGVPLDGRGSLQGELSFLPI